MTDTFLGVQPIFDSDHRIVAYELLFRSESGGFLDTNIDGDAATSNVILNAFADIGVERLGHDKRLFLNLTEGLIESGLIETLPPQRVALEILESVRVTPRLVEAAKRLKQLGHSIVLDDFIYQPEWQPLLELCDIVKVDVLGDDMAATRAKLDALPGRIRPQLLAEKVETAEQYAYCRALGFTLFQGYYLARPRVLSGKQPPENRLQVLKLLARLQDESIGLNQVEQLIAQDVTLSYRLLRFLGNAAISQGRPIHTLMQAISLVGLRTIRQWATLIAMGTVGVKREYSLTRSLTYARFCQMVGEHDIPDEKEALFTVGLFSNLDEILEIPLQEALHYLPLDESVKRAILGREGSLGAVLTRASCFESISDCCNCKERSLPGLSEEVLSAYFLDAFAWAQDVQSQIQDSHVS